MEKSHRIDEAQLAVLARTRGLELSPERCLALLPAWHGVQELLEVLDAVDVGETPPASTFDPRWDRQS